MESDTDIRIQTLLHELSTLRQDKRIAVNALREINEYSAACSQSVSFRVSSQALRALGLKGERPK